MAAAKEILINHPPLDGMGFSVDMKKYKLLQNGQPVPVKSGRYQVTDKEGKEINIRISRYNLKDFTPKIIIDKTAHNLLPIFSRTQYWWIALPVFVLFIFKIFLLPLPSVLFLLSTILLALYTNVKIFRSNMGAFGKYGLSSFVALISMPVLIILIIAWEFATGDLTMQSMQERYQTKKVQTTAEAIANEMNMPGVLPPVSDAGYIYEPVVANGDTVTLSIKTPIKAADFKESKTMEKLHNELQLKACNVFMHPEFINNGVKVIIHLKDNAGNIGYESPINVSTCNPTSSQ